MKIAMVGACPFPANRGTPSRILRMSEGLIDKGHDIHIVTYHLKDENIPLNECLIIHRTPDIHIYKKKSPGARPDRNVGVFLKNYPTIWRLENLLRARRPILWHIMTYYSHFGFAREYYIFF